MAELVAISDVRPTGSPAKSSEVRAEARQYQRRFALTPGRKLRLGRGGPDVDFAVPEDGMISSFHAVLFWTGTELTVQVRPSLPPDYPNPPTNPIWFNNKEYREDPDPVRNKSFPKEFTIRPGEAFAIGQTRFALPTGVADDSPCPVDRTVIQQAEEFTRDQLNKVPYTRPDIAFRALEQLPKCVKGATREDTLYDRVLKVLLDTLPTTNGAAVVQIPANCPPGSLHIETLRKEVRKASDALFGPDWFNPSRRLCSQAITTRKCCLHLWSTEQRATPGGSSEDMTIAFLRDQNRTPWAICTPLLDESRTAIYLTGLAPKKWGELDESGQAPFRDELTQYQKVVDTLAAMVESTVKLLRLNRLKAVTSKAWPHGIRKYLDDPERLEAMLRPQEKELTILFCDLRDYSLYASRKGDQLSEAWEKVSEALETMSGTITDRDGVVAGFRGDAVLGFWGWPSPHDRQIADATRAALRIHEKLSGPGRSFRSGLGLTHGRALVGRLGANDLAVVDLYGPVVNLAFRLEAMTKAFGVGIVVSKVVADGLTADADARLTRTLGHVRAKGSLEAVEVFELLAADSPAQGGWYADTWAEAVKLFTDGKWAEAYTQLHDTFRDDPAAQCLMRVMDQTGKRVPKGWDGSFVPVPPVE